MPARSKAQQRAAGAALAAKRGEGDPKKLTGASKEMYKSMTEKELDELASTKTDSLPDHVDQSEGP
jgi:2-methylcitrate dehydratase PrpD